MTGSLFDWVLSPYDGIVSCAEHWQVDFCPEFWTTGFCSGCVWRLRQKRVVPVQRRFMMFKVCQGFDLLKYAANCKEHAFNWSC